MLPDYPRLKKKLNDKMAQMIKSDMEKDPFLSSFPRHEAHEGHLLTTTSIEGFSSTTDFPETASNFEITFDETIREGPEAVFSRRSELSKDMIKKLTQQIIAALEKVTERTGNVVKANEVIGSSNPILDMLEKIEIDFDKSGNPIMPTMLLSPEDYKKFKEKFQEWDKNPEMEKRRKEIIEKKRKQWLDRENSRKLVD
ncbi:MAG: hypothetical protein M1167_05035 [Chloroflexi bacterium]|nr:hypothetical protein [Chloroflexota bacterium]